MRTGAARAAGLAAAAIVTASCSSSFGMPRGSTEQGQEIFDLWQIFFWAGIAVAAIVYGLIAWSVIRYRRRRRTPDAELGRQFHANVPLEIVYTAIPVVIVIVLFALSIGTEDRASSVSRDPDVILRTEAFSWGWRFEFADEGVEVVSEPSAEGMPGPEILLPLGRTTRIELTSNDVIHAFWVPDFLYKRDAIPGHVNEFDVTPTVLGTYHGVCSEFCGLHHAYMTFTVRVVEPDAFDAWLSDTAANTGGAA
ncbi:MAG: cytochrome c oxidase subunit II [Actinomycetota bacterium]|nr:cytochrome c oxidase subunit II [Actinomycetota bacterium]